MADRFDLSAFKQLLIETMAPAPKMRPTVADIKWEILARMNDKAEQQEVVATDEQRREMARWFANAVDQIRDGPIIMPVTKRLTR